MTRRHKPYDRKGEEDPWERGEWAALAEADFEGLPREALIASIHHLANRLLELSTADNAPSVKSP